MRGRGQAAVMGQGQKIALLAGGGTPRDDMSVMVLLLLDRQQAKGS